MSNCFTPCVDVGSQVCLSPAVVPEGGNGSPIALVAVVPIAVALDEQQGQEVEGAPNNPSFNDTQGAVQSSPGQMLTTASTPRKMVGAIKDDLLSMALAIDEAGLAHFLGELAKARPQIVNLHEVAETFKYHIDNMEDLEVPQTRTTLVIPEFPVIQFAGSMFYVSEGEPQAVVNLLRYGPSMSTSSAVYWETQDGSAKAGKNYVKSSGMLEFGPSMTHAQITVTMLDNANWDPTLDFRVVLKEDGLSNAVIHRYHMTCRVKITDNDTFPTNRFQEALSQGRVQDINPARLLIEYFKMNFKNPVVRKGSIRAFVHDVLVSLKFVLDQGIRVFLINSVLLPAMGKGFTDTDYVKLIVVVLLFLIPGHFLQLVACRRNLWKIGGGSRKLLQSNFVRKFMSYAPEASEQVDNGEVMIIMFDQIPEIVAKAYQNMFPLIQNFVQLILIIIYQLLAPYIFNKKNVDIGQIALLSLSVAFIFPIIMLCAFWLTSGKSLQLMSEQRDSKTAACSFTLDLLANLHMMADYGKRGHAADLFDAKIGVYNGKRAKHLADFTANKFVPVSLSMIIQAGWIFGGGLMLVNEVAGMDLGTFLANLAIFKMIGTCWSGIYQSLLNMQEVTRELRRLIRLMNFPSENTAERQYLESCAKESQSRLLALGKEPTGLEEDHANLSVDKLPIRLHKLTHRFDQVEALSSISLELRQGLLHGIAGVRRSGKSTLLRLIGGRTLPNPDAPENSLFVPQHLRIIHVSKQPLFFRGTLYDNLVYGVPEGDKDGGAERVLSICRHLNLTGKTLSLISADKGAQVSNWSELLPSSDQHLLNIVRALVCNPEVICIHQPSLGMGPRTLKILFRSLKLFVLHRGIAQDLDRFYFRRPRTCIISTVSEEDTHHVDEMHRPFS